MNNQEAISRQAVLETLDDMDNALDEDRTVENYKELLKECYEVLPSVNPQPCEDAISRQAVFEQINCWIGSGEYRYTNATHYLTERVKHISPVNPQDPETEIEELDFVQEHKKIPVTLQVQKYCDRNICVSNEYNGIGCDECEVTKSQEPQESEGDE